MTLIPLRLIISLLGVYACALVYTQRSAMSVAIVAMTTTKYSNNNSSTTEKFEPEFDWNEKVQGIILGSQFYLYIFVPAISGNISDKFGSKWINFLGAIVPCVLSLLTPIGIRKGGVGVLIAIRTVDGAFHGMVYASLFSIYTKWLTVRERAIANGSLFFGGSLGSTVMYALSGWACQTEIGWPLVYYINATLYIPWMILWIYFCTNDPAENRHISNKELLYIQQNVPQSTASIKPQTPWLQIFSSKPVLSSMFIKMSSGFGYFLMMTKMPSYLSSVLQIEIFTNGVFSAAITLLQGLCALLSAPLSNWIISKFNFKSLPVRKVFQTVAMIGPALCFALIPSLSTNSSVVFGLLLGAMFLYGTFTGGEWSTGSEYAPNSAGVVFGITNMLAFAMGVVAPLLVGILLDVEHAEIRTQWNIIFYITSGIYVVGLIPFLFFGTDKQQKWDKALENDIKKENLTSSYEEL